MVECAHAAVRYDPRLRGLYEQCSKRRGWGKAIVAVAHEMARIIYFMLRRDEPYRGANNGLTKRKLKSMERKSVKWPVELSDTTRTPYLLKRSSLERATSKR
jgi:hypothetical protein